MKNEAKTKDQLLEELDMLNQQIVELKKSRKLIIQQSDDALRESEELNRLVLSNISDAIFLTDDNGIFTFICPNVDVIFGYSFEEVQQWGNISKLLGEKLFVHSDLETLGEIRNITCDITDKSGKLHNLLVSVKCVSIKGGTQLYSCCDITEYRKIEVALQKSYEALEKRVKDRTVELAKTNLTLKQEIIEHKKVETALKESEKRFKQVAESAEEWIWEVDVDGLYTYASPVLEKILGYKPEEVIGRMHFYDFFTPEDREELKKVAFESFAMKKPFKGFINPNLHKNGTKVILETSGTPILGEKNEFMGYRGADTDITQRIQAELALKESEEKFRAIAENASEGILIGMGDKCVHVFANQMAAEITGYTTEELLKTSISDLVLPAELNKLMDIYKSRLAGNIVPSTHENSIVKKNGELVSVEIRGAKTVWEGQNADLVLINDITQRKNTEENLRRSEEKYRIIVESAQEGIWSLNKDGETTFVNPRMAEILGYAPDEMRGMHLFSFMDEKEFELAKFYMERRERGISERHDFEFMHKDGKKIYTSLETSPLKDDEGNYIGALAVVADVTERKMAEKKVQNQAELLEITHDAIILRETDGTIRFWNKGAEDLYGWNRDEVNGKISHEILNTQFPGSFEKIMDEVVNKGQWQGELIHQTKSGEELVVLSRWAIKTFKNSSHNQIMEVNRDISERKMVEKEIRRANNYNRSLIEVSLDPLFTIGSDGKITDVNNATEAVTGYSREKIVGTDFSEYFTEPEKARQGYHLVFEQGFVRDYSLEIQHKDGHVTPVLYNASVYRDESGEVLGVFAAARDITQIKKSMEEKEMLLKEIHHRVKNNLMVISSLLNLQSEYIKDEQALKFFEESQNRARSMAIIHEKLYQSSDLKNINFGEYIQTLTSELFKTYQVDPGLVKLKIDVEDIKLDINTAIPLGLIVNELVSNAMKHGFPSGGSGEIVIVFQKLDEHYFLKVSDDGVGFPHDIDFQMTESLGLQLVNSLVGQIDGVIKLDTSHGTSFTIKFKELELSS